MLGYTAAKHGVVGLMHAEANILALHSSMTPTLPTTSPGSDAGNPGARRRPATSPRC